MFFIKEILEMTDIPADDNQERLIRLSEVLKLLPISKSTWWSGVRSGRFPRPVKLGARGTCWQLSAIKKLLEREV
jgi:prophage regulatory protein